MTDTCPACGGDRSAPSKRFTVTFEDSTDSTAHRTHHRLCGNCWDQLLSEVAER